MLAVVIVMNCSYSKDRDRFRFTYWFTGFCFTALFSLLPGYWTLFRNRNKTISTAELACLICFKFICKFAMFYFARNFRLLQAALIYIIIQFSSIQTYDTKYLHFNSVKLQLEAEITVVSHNIENNIALLNFIN